MIGSESGSGTRPSELFTNKLPEDLCPSILFFIVGTLLLSLNFVRPFGFAISDWFYFGALLLTFIETLRVDRINFSCWTRNHFLWMAGLILVGATISTANSLFFEGSLLGNYSTGLCHHTVYFTHLGNGEARQDGCCCKGFYLVGGIHSEYRCSGYFAKTRFGPRLSGTLLINLWGRYAGTLGTPNKLGYFLVITSFAKFCLANAD